MRPVMFMGQIQAFENDSADYIIERLWDGGIRELVLGDLILRQGETQGPSFAPNADFYQGCAKQPPPLPADLAASSRIFGDAVKAAADKGFAIYFHDWGQFGWFESGSCLNNPEQVRYGLARTRDTFAQYPDTGGFVLDGPEYGYEIEPGHRSDVSGPVECLKPWVGLHHGGVRISSNELELLLQAIVASGLQSLIYWHYSDMSEEEWQVLQGFIG